MAERRTAAVSFVTTNEAANPKGKKTATTSSAKLVGANESRVALVVCNDGTNAVYLALGGTATKEEGIRLNKEGGTHIIDYYWGEVTCVTATGESNVCWAEA